MPLPEECRAFPHVRVKMLPNASLELPGNYIGIKLFVLTDDPYSATDPAMVLSLFTVYQVC